LLKPRRRPAVAEGSNFTGVLTRPWHSLLMPVHPFQLPI
jgi:hypothetical protein